MNIISSNNYISLDLLIDSGIISTNDADQFIMSRKMEVIRSIWDMPEPHAEANRLFINVPRKIQRQYNMPAKIRGKTKQVIVNKVYDYLILHDKKSLTLQQAFNLWFEEKKQDIALKPTTLEHYQNDFRIIEHLDLMQLPVSQITAQDIYKAYQTMTGNRYMLRKQFGNIKTVLSGVFDWCIVQGCVDNNPVKQAPIRGLKFKPQKIKEVYTTEERKTLCDALCASENVLDKALLLQFNTGCRMGEIRALRWSDVDFSTKKICIHRQLTGDGTRLSYEDNTKSGLDQGNRVLPMSQQAYEMLWELYEKSDKDLQAFVFLIDGEPIPNYSRINWRLRSWCKKLGIPYRSNHRIRATIATEAAKSDMDAVTMTSIFGWADIQTARSYIVNHAANEEMIGFFDQL